MIQITSLNEIDESLLTHLKEALDADARMQGAPVYDAFPLSVQAHDPNGVLVGALTGKTVWNWLYIELLWVDTAKRATGIGRQLMRDAEKLAFSRRCHSSYLWTESFQAPDFYSKLGYKQFVVKEDFPLGYQRIGFMKRLAA